MEFDITSSSNIDRILLTLSSIAVKHFKEDTLTHLKPGVKAPDFTGTDQNGNSVTLKDFAGKKLILYFYPKDNTPGCTKEACDFRDNFSELKEQGYEVVGVSIDNESSHQRFINKYNLPFTLIADTDKKMVVDYGVWGEKNRYGRKYMGIHRITFVIDEKGSIRHVIEKVKTAESTSQILQLEAGV